jgi:pectate lyase
MNLFKSLFSFVLLNCILFSAFSQIPVFPGAEGFGTFTPGGRNGKLIKVTNLNDNGPGSFREAIITRGPRIIVFETGGIINLETRLVINEPYVTIAGQSSPGGGICLRGEALQIATHDVVIRHLRIRPGEIDFGPSNNWDSIDALSIGNNQPGKVCNVVVDHCSFSWAIDENIGIWGDSHDLTIQNCIIAEALHQSVHPKGDHGMGMLVGSNATRISIHHNIFAHNNDRNPHINGKSLVDFRNNIIYNPGGMATDVGANNGQTIIYVNNYIIEGPRSRLTADLVVRNLHDKFPKVFVEGNINRRRSFELGYFYDNDYRQRIDILHDTIIVPKIDLKVVPDVPKVTTFLPKETLSYAIGNAGAIFPVRDPVDRKLIVDIQSGRDGMMNSKQSMLEWPSLEGGIMPIDNDNDGMPDHWEEKYDLDTTYKDHNEDFDGDGYTNIEEFLNQSDPDNILNVSFLDNALLSNFSRHGYPSSLNLELYQNYPNPFRDSTNIKFSLNVPSKISINVYDQNGRIVAKVLNGFLYEGKYQIVWENSGLKEGSYNLVLSSGKIIDSKKMIIINK